MSDSSEDLALDLRADVRDEAPRVRRHALLALVLGVVCAGCAYLYVGRRRRAWLVVPSLWVAQLLVALLVVLGLLPLWTFPLVPLARLLARFGTALDAAVAAEDIPAPLVPRWRDYALVAFWTWSFTLVLFPLTALVAEPMTMHGAAMEPALRTGDHVVSSRLAAFDVQEGDIVSYLMSDGRASHVYVSRVREIVDADGVRMLRLQPDGEAEADSPLRRTIREDQVIGRVLGVSLPGEVMAPW